MEEFVTEIQSNIGTLSGSNKKTSKFRALLGKIIASPSEINIVDKCNEDGDVIFEVPMRSIGVPYDVLVAYKEEISSDFAANFIGELLVRENIDQFAKIMTDLKDNYSDRVNKFVHGRFGMKIYKDKFILRFHISLVQKILTEDFRKKMI